MTPLSRESLTKNQQIPSETYISYMLRILGANFAQTTPSNTDISALKSRKVFLTLSVNHWDVEDLYQL